MEKHQLIIELHYMPAVQYFALLDSSDQVRIEACENYQKQSYRNRCWILGANKTQSLIIPVKHSGPGEKKIRKVKIDYGQSWTNNHIRAIKSAYGKAPFYEYYVDEFTNILEKHYEYLFDLNYELLTKCLELLGIQKAIEATNKYEIKYEKPYLDARNSIHPKKSADKPFSFSPRSYQQVFGKEFAGELSVLDLIFCEGPNAIEVIRSSRLIFMQ